MHPVVVLNIVGLTPSLIGESTPNLSRFADGGTACVRSRTIIPAVTCTVQSTFLTGVRRASTASSAMAGCSAI